jgi:acetyl esterase/lipase
VTGDIAVPQADILTRPARPPDHVLRYGPREDQIADLRLPVRGHDGASRVGRGTPADGAGQSRLPLVIFFHGGFWRAAFDRRHIGPLADALAESGFAVCTPEFRRTGQPGGGWPGTFDDVAVAMDALPSLVARVSGGLTDPSRLVVGGHSAGGHLALWTAGRVRLPAGERWHARRSPAAGVVSLAGVCDLAACYRLNLDDGAAGELMGGGPESFAARYLSADPMGLLPTGMAARLVHGTADDRVPVSQSQEYAARAWAAGDDARCDLLAGYGHFEVIDPLSGAWPRVLAAFRSAAGGVGGTGGAGPGRGGGRGGGGDAGGELGRRS